MSVSMPLIRRWRLFLLLSAIGIAHPVSAQDAIDQADEMDRASAEEQRGDLGDQSPRVRTGRISRVAQTQANEERLTIGSIIVDGNEALPDLHFVDLIEQYTARPSRSPTSLTLPTRSPAARAMPDTSLPPPRSRRRAFRSACCEWNSTKAA